MLISLYRWFTRSAVVNGEQAGDQTAPVETIVLRLFALLALLLFVVATFATRPRPGVHGQGAIVLAAAIAMVAAGLCSRPLRAELPARARIAALLAVSGFAAVLAALQSSGIWEAAVYFDAVVAALWLERLAGVLVLIGSIVVIGVVAAAAGRGGVALSVSLGALPWFFVVRLMRTLRSQRDMLDASRAAEAQAAVAAERGRLVREMHDVLAHSLSALALQLESTRLLAHERGVDEQVARAVDQAHHVAASGLEEARRVIAAERGDELPGPERIGALADAFGEQSGLPVAVEIDGQPRELAPEARLAVYRTAQEALTNVRRHATPERVSVRLEYMPASTVLVVEDYARPGAPAPFDPGVNGSGYGLTGMRERAELLGGELLAAPTSDGFRVELRLPL